ncbi:hypothetical protein J2X12_003113 [Pseudarthrobacter oxydans]|uniref:Uncharacterized protein n=1 Tax=Pseudarthrobacter oxydans TaxID=1671 RepID=A0AAW8NGB1_PSEOX|nr:hypothetical protein [Pseudarthrobacter oxydans]MDR6793608.1 hypothetical protein [Pseudarthrobacter oxydans]MDR7165068.1 hypothetical protein [Pseudarthrobacter oxydans]
MDWIQFLTRVVTYVVAVAADGVGPDWIQAITSVPTLLAAIAAGLFAGKAAVYTKHQAQASNRQVEIALEALEITRTQAASAEEHANRQVEEAQDTYRRYEESKLDALMPVVLATARRPGSWFIETNEVWESGEWPPFWEPFTRIKDFDESQNYRVRFRISIKVELENVSNKIARIDIVDNSSGEVDVRGGEAIIVPPGQVRAFTWTRTFTPVILATQDEIDDPKNWLFSLTLWVRDLGMNVRDVYKFNSDLRFFSRDGSRLVVRPEPAFSWTENVAQPLQQRAYERLEANAATTLHLSGSGGVTRTGE